MTTTAASQSAQPLNRLSTAPIFTRPPTQVGLATHGPVRPRSQCDREIRLNVSAREELSGLARCPCPSPAGARAEVAHTGSSRRIAQRLRVRLRTWRTVRQARSLTAGRGEGEVWLRRILGWTHVLCGPFISLRRQDSWTPLGSTIVSKRQSPTLSITP